MKTNCLRKVLMSLLIMAGCYLLVDLPFQVTEMKLFTGVLGPKNCLPVLTCLLLGPFSAVGLCLGAVLSGLILRSDVLTIFLECLCVLAMGWGSRLLWYSGKGARPVKLKCWRDIGRLMCCAAIPALLCAAVGGLLLWRGSMFWQILISCLTWNFLLGVPVLILSVSILGTLPVCPAHCSNPPDLEETLPPGVESIELASDRLETLSSEGRLGKKIFQVQNCIEELLLRILAAGTWEGFHLRVYADDSVCFHLSYAGVAYNPLRAGRRESKEDLIGLLLIRQRALRASYRYRSGINELHIVL